MNVIWDGRELLVVSGRAIHVQIMESAMRIHTVFAIRDTRDPSVA